MNQPREVRENLLKEVNQELGGDFTLHNKKHLIWRKTEVHEGVHWNIHVNLKEPACIRLTTPNVDDPQELWRKQVRERLNSKKSEIEKACRQQNLPAPEWSDNSKLRGELLSFEFADWQDPQLTRSVRDAIVSAFPKLVKIVEPVLDQFLQRG